MLIQPKKHAHRQFIQGKGMYGNFLPSVGIFSHMSIMCSVHSQYRSALYTATAFILTIEHSVIRMPFASKMKA